MSVCAVLCFTLCKVNEEKCLKSEKTGSAVWVADVLGWSLGCLVMQGESQHLQRFPECPKPAGGPWLHVTDPMHTTQDWKQQAHALLCCGNSPLWSHQHLKTRQMAESRAGSSPALHPLYTGTQPAEGPGRGQSNLSTWFVLRAWRVTRLVTAHRTQRRDWGSSWAECSPHYPAECFQRVTRKYQSPVFLGTCPCSTGKTSALQKNFSAQHRTSSPSCSLRKQSLARVWLPSATQSTQIHLYLCLSRFVLLKASVFSAAAELSELGLVRHFFFPFLGEKLNKVFFILVKCTFAKHWHLLDTKAKESDIKSWVKREFWLFAVNKRQRIARQNQILCENISFNWI